MATTADELKKASESYDKKLDDSKEWEGDVTVKIMSRSLESDYFWLRDYITGPLEYTLWRQDEKKTASVFSQFHGEYSQKKQALERRAMEIFATINTVVQSVTRILYDLREYNRLLTIHKGLKSGNASEKKASIMSAKRVFLDEVDIKKGRGSINSLSVQLEFVTLRDAFMGAKNLDDVEKMDLNDRVKRILLDRVREYENWVGEWEKTLNQQKNLLLAYLKSQYGTLKLYIQWVEPYLKAVKNLEFSDKLAAEKKMIQIFETNVIRIEFFGEKELISGEYQIVKGGDVVKKKEKYKPKKGIRVNEAKKYSQTGPKARKIVRVVMEFASNPRMIAKEQGGGVYRQIGTLNVKLSTHGFDEFEWKKFEELKNKLEEEEENILITAITGGSLAELRDEIEENIKEYEEKVGKKKEKEPKKGKKKKAEREHQEYMFKDIYNSFVDNFSFIKPGAKKEKTGFPVWRNKDAAKIAKELSKEDGKKLYKDYKDRHGLPG